jgi:Fic family protein
MINILQQIDQQKQELENLRPIKPEYLAKIREKFKLEYNFYSNNLEGNTLTLGETRSLILHSYKVTIDKKLKDIEEMKSHLEVYDEVGFLQDKILTKDKKPVELNQNLIKNLHKQIFVEDEKRSREENGITKYYTIPAGNYKLEQNHVITPTGEKFYYSEPEMVPQMMTNLVDWYNKKRLELHPVVLAAIFHYKFIRIHPFGDGNGRMARFLMNMILQSGGYSLAVVKSDDKNREKYLQSLQKTDQNFFDIQTCLESDQIELFEAFITEVSELVLHSTDLMIRGAKGEDITETKDLLRLFEMELKTKKGEDLVNNKNWLLDEQNKLKLEQNYKLLADNVEDFVKILGEECFEGYEKLLPSEHQILEGVHWEFKDKKTGNRIYKIVLYLLVKFDNSYWNISLDFRKHKWYGENLGQHEKTYKYGEFISENDIKEFIAFLIKTSKEFLDK